MRMTSRSVFFLRFATLIAVALVLAGCRKKEVQQEAGPGACPSEIETTAAIAPMPEGWSQRDLHTNQAWSDVAFFNGDPRKGSAELKSQKSSAVKDHYNRTWKFSASGGSQIWMACRYDNSKVSLLRPVSENVSECKGEYLTDPNSLIQGLTCK